MNDARDLDAPQYQTHVKAADRQYLIASLHTSIEAARSLATYYDNVAKTLGILLDQVEATK